jgi:hypothetical protein
LEVPETLGSKGTVGPAGEVIKDLVKFQGLIEMNAQRFDQIMS